MRNARGRQRRIRQGLGLLLAMMGFACADDLDEPVENREAVVQQEVTLETVLLDGCDAPSYFLALEPYLEADARAVENGLAVQDSSIQFEQYMEGEGVVPFYDLFTPETARVLHQNETHDCQRMIVEGANGLEYGPLVQIALQRALADLPIGTGRVMAELYNFDATSYPPLGIGPAANCLWMQPGPEVGSLQTLMLQPSDQTCQGVNPGNAASSTTLRTVPRAVLGANPPPPPGLDDVYPRTARWMWDEAAELQYIGVRCDWAPDGGETQSRWCEVTPTALTSTANNAYPNSMALPGWTDRQRLAYWDSTTNALVVSGLMGEIRPGPAVQYQTPATQLDVLKLIGAGGQVAAIVRLEGNDPAARAAYAVKMGINTAPAAGVSIGQIRMQVVTVGGVDRWQGWAEARPGQVKDLEVAVNRPHSGLGTVRWRWSDTDEKGWLPCREGCCTWHEDNFT